MQATDRVASEVFVAKACFRLLPLEPHPAWACRNVFRSRIDVDVEKLGLLDDSPL